ncbi:uncharacterized protein [Dysidea avara]|uniref:uncharacterized protein n=1 Tax=Dysidea avara TaxID=196820 RepID=UPI00332111E4
MSLFPLLTKCHSSAKLFLQQLWQEYVSWDTTLNDDLLDRWKVFSDAITNATTLPFPCKYAASLLRPQRPRLTFIHHVKVRAAPLKQLTLPRLELKAAVLAAKLSSSVKTSLSLDCTVKLWSDSQIVLHWIAIHKPLRAFVTNRVEEIRSISTCWKGITAEQLRSSDLWVHGPTWVPTQSAWPTWDPAEVLLTCLELECIDQVHSDYTKTDHNPPVSVARIININDYSKLTKLLVVTAYTLRFAINARRTSPITTDTHLSPTELVVATVKWIHAVQHDHFPAEVQNLQSQSQRLPLVRQLRLFLDKDMLLRCSGRIHNAPLSELAFHRFTSRRSTPRPMLSDNEATYQAVVQELQKLFTSATLTEDLARQGVEWRFIPKRGPWFGGFWEWLIRLTKSTLKKVLGQTYTTLESLQTMTTEMEAVLNNQPLTYVSSDANDIEPITPAHLLHDTCHTTMSKMMNWMIRHMMEDRVPHCATWVSSNNRLQHAEGYNGSWPSLKRSIREKTDSSARPMSRQQNSPLWTVRERQQQPNYLNDLFAKPPCKDIKECSCGSTPSPPQRMSSID